MGRGLERGPLCRTIRPPAPIEHVMAVTLSLPRWGDQRKDIFSYLFSRNRLGGWWRAPGLPLPLHSPFGSCARNNLCIWRTLEANCVAFNQEVKKKVYRFLGSESGSLLFSIFSLSVCIFVFDPVFLSANCLFFTFFYHPFPSLPLHYNARVFQIYLHLRIRFRGFSLEMLYG